MKRMLLVAALLAPVALAWAEDRKEDASKLVGTWTVTASNKEGKKEAAADIKGKQVRITRDTITCQGEDGKSEMTCTYTVDTSSKPWKVTMQCTEGEHKGKKLTGIAKLEGDTLQICYSKPDKEAPAGFDGKEGQCCITLERSKK